MANYSYRTGSGESDGQYSNRSLTPEQKNIVRRRVGELSRGITVDGKPLRLAEAGMAAQARSQEHAHKWFTGQRVAAESLANRTFVG